MTQSITTQTSMHEFDFDLPPRLIAQTPLECRSDSRLLVLDRSNDSIQHRHFGDLSAYLRPGDLLVVNDTRVIPARLIGQRHSGATVEVLLLREEQAGLWRALVRPAKRLRTGEQIAFNSHHNESGTVGTATLLQKLDDGEALVQLDDRLSGQLGEFGRIPLPPYITDQLDDDERYQTVFSTHPGSAAAPTAGLHFTTKVLDDLKAQDVQVERITLHVGLDTFRPITEEFAENHLIHKEWCSVPRETAEALASAKERGNRVIAVGTTVARTLEAYAQSRNLTRREGFSGMIGIFITPGYSWKLVDAMVTNFHLPRSTLLLMISSFAGKERILHVYQEAIAAEYRFFSFGDAMLIL